MSIGGCVENIDASEAPVKGWMMNMCAVAGLATSGTRLAMASIFRNAFTSGCGEPTICAAPASAANRVSGNRH